jgi:bifunctional UDP-N-acetylglucosamine pyrophosphorylase/glucosamine-1-phosphate N-acetyltransferase
MLPSDAMTQTTTSVLPVVMAAGLGTRMKSRKPKVLHELCGRPMLAYVLDAAREVSGRRPLVVYSPATAALTEAFAAEADFALQDEPLGTADAVRAAMQGVPEEIGEILVLSGDVPLVQADLLADLIDTRRARNAAVALISVHTGQPEGLGRIVRTDDGGQVLRIVEQKDATPDELEIEEINAGVYAFDAAWLRRRIGDVKRSPASGEFYLPELVILAREDRRPVVSLEVEDDGTLAGINDRAQLAAAEFELRLAINERHMLAGVTVVDPASTYVDFTVELAPDVVLEPGVILRGSTKIGEGTRIGAARSSTRSSAATATSGPASSSVRKWKTRSRSGPSRTCAPAPRSGARPSSATSLRSRPAASRRACSSTISATSATPRSASGPTSGPARSLATTTA